MATTTSTANVDVVKRLGADVVVDYKTEDFSTVLRDYDVVLDLLGGETQEGLYVNGRPWCSAALRVFIVYRVSSNNALQRGAQLSLRAGQGPFVRCDHSTRQSAGIEWLLSDAQVKGTIARFWPK